MQAWDYRVISCEYPDQFEEAINEQGANGWELVSSVAMFDNMFFMLKRPKKKRPKGKRQAAKGAISPKLLEKLKEHPKQLENYLKMLGAKGIDVSRYRK